MIARPGPLAAARPADRLGEELVRPLGGALVGQVEGDVGRHDADERDLRDVEALRDEARADEDVQLAVRERVDDPLRGMPALDDVPVEPADAQVREARPDLAPRPAGCRRRGSGSGATRRPGSGVASGVAVPQWWQRRVIPAWWKTSGSVHSGQAWTSPQSRHRTADAAAAAVHDEDRPLPGRRVERASSAAASRSEMTPRLPAASSARRSTTSTTGGAPLGRVGSTTRRYVPARTRPTDSTDGVALPRTTAAPASRPSSIARGPGVEPRRPLALVRAVVLLVDDDEAEVGRAARAPPGASRRRSAPRRTGCAATRRPARPPRGRSGRGRSPHRARPAGGRRAAARGRSPGRAGAPAGPPRAPRRWPRRRSRSCRRRSRRRAGAASGRAPAIASWMRPMRLGLGRREVGVRGTRAAPADRAGPRAAAARATAVATSTRPRRTRPRRVPSPWRSASSASGSDPGGGELGQQRDLARPEARPVGLAAGRERSPRPPSRVGRCRERGRSAARRRRSSGSSRASGGRRRPADGGAGAGRPGPRTGRGR